MAVTALSALVAFATLALAAAGQLPSCTLTIPASRDAYNISTLPLLYGTDNLGWTYFVDACGDNVRATLLGAECEGLAPAAAVHARARLVFGLATLARTGSWSHSSVAGARAASRACRCASVEATRAVTMALITRSVLT